jgi:hypothetical protein
MILLHNIVHYEGSIKHKYHMHDTTTIVFPTMTSLKIHQYLGLHVKKNALNKS